MTAITSRMTVPDEMPDPLRSAIVTAEQTIYDLWVKHYTVKRAMEDIPRTGAGGVDHRKMRSDLERVDAEVEDVNTSIEAAYVKLWRAVNGWKQRHET